jgi:hypothetical protein
LTPASAITLVHSKRTGPAARASLWAPLDFSLDLIRIKQVRDGARYPANALFPECTPQLPDKGRFPGGLFLAGRRRGKLVFQGCPMEWFVRNANIRLYQKLLEEETNDEKSKVIRRLLAEETMKSGPGEVPGWLRHAQSAPK